ncbi:SAM-dependent methyltransferase, partial [Streptococcus anginosus]
TLPEHFDGIIIGNEVLDAMPVERLIYQDDGFQQIGVSLKNDELIEAIRPLTQAELTQTAALYFPPLPSYTSELHPA